MLQRTGVCLKKGFTHHPGPCPRGGKNLAWRPKMPESQREQFVPLNMVHPERRPNTWHDLEFARLGFKPWPKEVGFFNAGDNFEVTPEMHYRLFKKNHEEDFWGPRHNEKAVIHLMPLVEQDPVRYMPRVDEIFKAHIRRFGVDHLIFNSVMQACAFAGDMDRCLSLFEEMQQHGLVPNAQTFINLMLAVFITKQPRENAEAYFKEGVARGAFDPVMRLDTEFQMWWDQINRMGSFKKENGGYLSNKEEGAKPVPKDMWAIWGWDQNERKFVSKTERVEHELSKTVNVHQQLRSSVYTKYRRQPWAKFRGMRVPDHKGPLNPKAYWDDPAPFHNEPTPNPDRKARGTTVDVPQ